MAANKRIDVLEEKVKLLETALAELREKLETVPVKIVESVAAETVETDKVAKKKDEIAKLKTKIDGGKSKKPDDDNAKMLKLVEQLKKLEATEEKKEKKSKKEDTESAESAEEGPKKKTRLTPPEMKIIKEVLDKNFVEKESAKKYMEYFNGLTAEQQKAKKMSDHVHNCFNGGGSNAAGSGGPASESPAPTEVSWKTLRAQAADLEDTHDVHVYRNKKTQEYLRGPDEMEDEDFEPTTIDDVEYVVGDKTKRVYIDKKGSGPDVFVGFWGIGKFRKHDM